jgi:polysaccharide pyruvyl transferase WcaK-like protein
MDLRELHMLDYAFQYARRRKIRSGVFGCGVGPLKKHSFKKAAGRILSAADFVILRDRLSLVEAQRLTEKPASQMHAAIDPAAFCALRYKEISKGCELSDTILINFRDLSFGYEEHGADGRYFDMAAQIVRAAFDLNPGKKLLLMPHHYFTVGGDDRFFLNQVKYELKDREIRVQNEPLTLQKTLRMFESSALNIGMRFHFILLSAFLNGHCRIVNYTGATKGKISGFLNDYDPEGFFNDRRMVVLDGEVPSIDKFDVIVSQDCFKPSNQKVEAAFDTYRSVLSAYLG